MAYVLQNGSETLNCLPINDAINHYVLLKTLKFLNNVCSFYVFNYSTRDKVERKLQALNTTLTKMILLNVLPSIYPHRGDLV